MELEEEALTNKMAKRLSQLLREKQQLANAVEAEEEHISNTLQKRLAQVGAPSLPRQLNQLAPARALGNGVSNVGLSNSSSEGLYLIALRQQLMLARVGCAPAQLQAQAAVGWAYHACAACLRVAEVPFLLEWFSFPGKSSSVMQDTTERSCTM